MGIELPPLNAALVEVHRELAKVTIGAKDMATKNKNVWKAVKQTQEELQKGNARIAKLEQGVASAPQRGGSTDNTDGSQVLRKELEAEIAIAAKARQVAQLAESEIDRLCFELRQLSDRETNIQAKGRKATKALEEKLGMEEKAHAITKEERGKLQEEFSKLQTVN